MSAVTSPALPLSAEWIPALLHTSKEVGKIRCTGRGNERRSGRWKGGLIKRSIEEGLGEGNKD